MSSERTFTQSEVNRLMTREKERGRRAERARIEELLGMSVEVAAEVLRVRRVLSRRRGGGWRGPAARGADVEG